MTKPDADDFEIVEVIEEVLDNQTFMLAVAGGIVVGAILLYAWQEYQKGRIASLAPRSAPMPIDTDDDRPEAVAPVMDFTQPGW